MSQDTLLLSAAFAIVSGTVFAFVGNVVQRRPAPSDVRLPSGAFAAWWYGLAAGTIIGAVHTATAAYGRASLESALLTTHVGIALFCIALWGLVYYLLYLYSGWLGLWMPLAIGYVLYYALLVYYITASEPSGVKVGTWDVQLDYANQLKGAIIGVVVVLLLVPQILAAIAYFLLFFRTKDRGARYRIALVSFAIILWFTIPLVGVPLGIAQELWWQLFTRLLGLGAAFTVLAAYRPPAWVRTHYGIAPA